MYTRSAREISTVIRRNLQWADHSDGRVDMTEDGSRNDVHSQ